MTDQQKQYSLYTVKQEAQKLVELAEKLGVVVTINVEQQKPLAMRNYKMVVDCRLKLTR